MKKYTLNLFFLSSLLLLSCSSDDDTPVLIHEEEVISTVIINFTPKTEGETVVLKSQDLDGDGPNAPVITTTGDFIENTAYTASVSLLNETVDPVEDISEEVKEEGAEHQFFFNSSAVFSELNYEDEDENGHPIGLEFSVKTKSSTTGSFGITLKHLPKKPNSGIEDAGGETDVAQNFDVVIN